MKVLEVDLFKFQALDLCMAWVFLHPGNIQSFQSKSLEDGLSFPMGVGYIGFIRALPLFSEAQSEVVVINISYHLHNSYGDTPYTWSNYSNLTAEEGKWEPFNSGKSRMVKVAAKAL